MDVEAPKIYVAVLDAVEQDKAEKAEKSATLEEEKTMDQTANVTPADPDPEFFSATPKVVESPIKNPEQASLAPTDADAASEPPNQNVDSD